MCVFFFFSLGELCADGSDDGGAVVELLGELEDGVRDVALEGGRELVPRVVAEVAVRGDEEQREVLRHTYKDAALAPAEKIARVRAVFDALDVPRLTEQQISLRFDRALATLDGLNVPDARKEPLREYARSLMGRRK